MMQVSNFKQKKSVMKKVFLLAGLFILFSFKSADDPVTKKDRIR